MKFGKKWSELSPEQQKKAKEQFGSKQGWQDAKAKSQGYKNEADKKGGSKPSSTKPAASPSPKPSGSKNQSGITAQQPSSYFGQPSSNKGAGPKAPKTEKTTYRSRYDKKWDQLSDKQKAASGSQKEHKEKRRDLGLTKNSPMKSDFFASSGKGQEQGPQKPSVTNMFSAVADTPQQGPQVSAPTTNWKDLSKKERKEAKATYGSKQDYKQQKKSGQTSFGAVGQSPYTPQPSPELPKTTFSQPVITSEGGSFTSDESYETYPTDWFDGYAVDEYADEGITTDETSSSSDSNYFGGGGANLKRFDPFGYMSGLAAGTANRFGSKAQTTGMFNQAHDFTSDQRLRN